MASSTWCESSFSPAASRSAVRSATPPISRSGWRTVVSGGEREPGQLGVVEADDAEVLGHPQPAARGPPRSRPRRSRRCPRTRRSAAPAGRAGRSPPATPSCVGEAAGAARTPSGTGTPGRLHRGPVAVHPGLVAGRGRRARRRRRSAGARAPSRCWVAASPPAKLVAPTLVTRARGRSIGSITTSGRRARASAVDVPRRSASLTTVDHRLPARPRPGSRTHGDRVVGHRAARARAAVTATVTPASVAGVQRRPG